MFYEDGTYECYELFRSKAKITTYKSLKWHLLVIWYLNPQLTQDEFEEEAYVLDKNSQGYTRFSIGDRIVDKLI